MPQTQGGDCIAREFDTGQQMNPKGLRIIAFMMSRGNSLVEDESNANIVAAAPELYEALTMFMDMWNSGKSSSSSKAAQKARADMWDKAAAAMAKARGESK